MKPNPIGIGAYATPTGCACGNARRTGVGQSGALSEATWVLGIGALVMIGITAVVLSRSFKEARF